MNPLADMQWHQLQCYDRQGNPISWEDRIALCFSAYRRGESYQRIGADLVGPYDVSTIWLGIDAMPPMKRGGAAKPLIFETMVFADDRILEQVRYSTEAEAIAGHAAMVELYRSKL